MIRAASWEKCHLCHDLRDDQVSARLKMGLCCGGELGAWASESGSLGLSLRFATP